LLNHLKKSKDLLQKNNSISELEIISQEYNLVDLINSHCSPKADAEISTELSLRTSAYSATLLKLIGEYDKSLFEKISDYGLSLISEYTVLRIHLLKFLAILPCLEHDFSGREIKRLFLESLTLLKTDKSDATQTLPLFLTILLPALLLISRFIPAYLLANLLRFGSKMMAKRFIAGENIKKSLPTIRQLSQTGRDATLDQLGELVLCEEEADHYKNKVLEIIHGLGKLYVNQERNPAGILRAHISIKTTALGSQLKPHAFDDCYQKIAPRLVEILLAAKKAHVFVNIDAEHYHFRDLVWKIYSKVLYENKQLYSWSDTGIVVQAYLVDGAKHLKEILKFQHERKVLMPIRLVKGAYWDAETIEAKAHHFDPPQFLNKIETDIHFRQLAYELIANPYTQLVVASHNVIDHCYVESLRATFFPRSALIEHQCLHMTYEALSVSLVKMGFVVRNYMPVGNLLVGMAYLVRRIMENSSQVGVLKMMRSHQSLNPDQNILNDWLKARNHWQHSDLSFYSEKLFENISPARLYLDEHWQQYNSVSSILIHEKDLMTPSMTAVEDTPKIMSAMHDAWATSQWRVNFMLRTTCLLQAKELFCLYRDEIATVIIQTAHKAILEAYADVDEAIDFINYYVIQFLEFKKTNSTLENFQPLGVVAAITPWNFPFAIPAGMTIAPLMAGNAVVLKAAEQTPEVAMLIEKFLHLAKVPSEIFKQFIGSGQTVGRAITDSQDLHGLVFTGSAEVGTMLYKKLFGKLLANKLGQKFIRPVITEMGGKNAIIVTQNAELDETISGILYSAFAHAGQKCSACSRIIVDKKILPVFKKRLLSSILAVKVGVASDPAVLINPVITAGDKKRLIEYKNKAMVEALSVGGKILCDLQEKYLEENIIGPLVIELPSSRAKHHESYSHKEAFGPILHLISYSTLDEAIDIANSTNYALTAGLYSQSPFDIEQVMLKIESGNIYINRPNTGARVGIEPFGGFKLSGTGPKAGGRYYVNCFMHDNNYSINDYFGSAKNENLSALETTSDESPIFPLPQLQIQASSSAESHKRIIFELFEREFLKTTSKINAAEKLKWKKHQLNIFENIADGKLIILNENCPGQKSFSKWDLSKKLAIFWPLELELGIKDLIYLTSLLTCKIPLIIVTSNSEVRNKWNHLLQELVVAGYPRNLMVVWYGHEKQLLHEISKLSILELIHLSTGNVTFYHELLSKLILHFSYKQHLPQITSSFSSSLSFETDIVLQHFYHERAYAINVMRHGAPLES
jgi:RHH-type proline utilization regulon transcriptional repressor/proline dehydrogenase/delta 1-pyrroline-5-carboxylate dehydrogenase